MRVSHLIAAAGAALGVASAANGQASFTVPDRSITNTWQGLDLTASTVLPNGAYSGITITYDYDSSIAGGNAWSSEGRSWFSTLNANANTLTTPTFPVGNTNYSSSVLSNTGGASNSNDINNLTFNFGFSGLFNYTGAQTVIWNHRQAFSLSATQTINWRNIRISFNAFVPPAPPAGAVDLGIIGNNAYPGKIGGSLAAGEIKWFKFTVDAGGLSPLDIHTWGSSFDTEIGLYDSNGFRVAENDDYNTGGPNLTSRLGWGGGSGVDIDGVGSLAPFSGTSAGHQAGALVPGATYYLALAAFNTGFNPNNFNVASASTSTGTYSLNFIPAPGAAALLVAGGVVAGRRRRA